MFGFVFFFSWFLSDPISDVTGETISTMHWKITMKNKLILIQMTAPFVAQECVY